MLKEIFMIFKDIGILVLAITYHENGKSKNITFCFMLIITLTIIISIYWCQFKRRYNKINNL